MQRFELDAARQLLHRLWLLQINTASTIDAIEQEVRRLLAPFQPHRASAWLRDRELRPLHHRPDRPTYTARSRALTRDLYTEVKRVVAPWGSLKSRLAWLSKM